MTAEPLRSVSAPAPNSMEDTSLVLPSDRKQCTGQQRVREQVKSIRRSKSVKNDSVTSTTSPVSATEYSEPKFQFSPTKLNATLFKVGSSNMSTRQNRMTVRSVSMHNTVRRKTQSTRQYDSQINWVSKSAYSGVKASDSEFVVDRSGTQLTKDAMQRSATMRVTRTSVGQKNNGQSQMKNDTMSRSKSEPTGMNETTGSMPNITLQDAVEYLTCMDVSYQLCGASFIQHHTFTEDKAKQQVWQLGGIPALIYLLKVENSQLQQTASAALRNVVYKDSNNKLQVESCGGLEPILTLLRDTNITETQKQLTGLLWNLSSADTLKAKLIRCALPLLTENIVMPYTCWTDSNTSKLIDPEVFYNTTGCLRNLSYANEEHRRCMRNCPGLIDSLMTHVQSEVESGQPDDKSVENCVCIFLNLSYQLEKEAPDHFKQFPVEAPHENTSKKSIFSPKRTKTQKFSFPEIMEGEPEGVSWLYHTKSLQLYLSLLSSSHKEATLEACCGALQNLTSSKSPMSTMMSQTIIQKMNGLSVISPLLKSGNSGLQMIAMSLVGNMSRVSFLLETLAKAVLPDVASVLTAVTPSMVKYDRSIATACRVMHKLLLAEPQSAKNVLNTKLIDSLTTLSESMSFETARNAAGVLLYTMWGQKDIQNVLKKQGMNKDTFINAVTTTSYKFASSMNGH
ncbi:plakophilin-1-like isoform X2 [Myxocyprinus asiaticus]|uniref:plakophilin-1-like isoform X2 n=1 Tax=Myxocyprinus asiaticus TaxID=70543 RepID=UPI0022233340|nr:plakophilin-1-like isoform X2 [Myxocyprinus asiaticus]